MQVEINKKGIKETFNFDNYGKLGKRKKAMKLATVRMLPQIIEEGKLKSDNIGNYHNSESSNKFAYIEAKVQIEGQDVVVKIDIKKSPQKNKFWVHSIDIKEKVDGLPADTSRVLKRANEHIDSIESISNADGNVNSEDIAPVGVAENTTATAEKVTPKVQGNVNEDDYAPISEEQALRNAEADREAFNSLTDADMPPEAETPIYSADTSSIKEKNLKDISAMARDILFLTPKERRRLEDVVHYYLKSTHNRELCNFYNELYKINTKCKLKGYAARITFLLFW